MVDAVISFKQNVALACLCYFTISIFPFRDIIQRVAEIMKIYGFIHVAEAYAVGI